MRVKMGRKNRNASSALSCAARVDSVGGLYCNSGAWKRRQTGKVSAWTPWFAALLSALFKASELGS